jgi:hypothetical protein
MWANRSDVFAPPGWQSRRGIVIVTDDLAATAIEAAGGQKLWNTLRGLTVDLSVGGPIWAMKGWPAGATVDQTVTLDTADERIEFSPFTPARLADDVRCRHRHRGTKDTRRTPRWQPRSGAGLVQRPPAINVLERPTSWVLPGLRQLELLRHPLSVHLTRGSRDRIEPWHEAGQTWRRLHLRFPSSIATHNPEQVFYFDSTGLQRRMDHITEVLGSTSSATTPATTDPSRASSLPPRRRIFRRNPDNTVNLNQPSITLDIVEFNYANEEAHP